MKNLSRERHKGFYSYEDAYDWIVDEFDGDSRYKFGFKFCSLEDLIKKELYVEKTSATNHNYFHFQYVAFYGSHYKTLKFKIKKCHTHKPIKRLGAVAYFLLF